MAAVSAATSRPSESHQRVHVALNQILPFK